MSSSLCVIIPMYNEKIGAAHCVDVVMEVLKKQKSNRSLLIVNDGSTDTTLSILRKKKKQYGNRLIIFSYTENQGYGRALYLGVCEALKRNFTFALMMDSDLTNNPSDIPRFIALMSKKVDCVKASRYSSGGKMVGVPAYRKFVSLIGNRIAAFCFNLGIHDCTNGFRMVRLKLYRNIVLHERKFSIILEELYELKKRNARFAEIPVTLTNRKVAKTSFSYKPKVFWDYGKYALRALCLQYMRMWSTNRGV